MFTEVFVKPLANGLILFYRAFGSDMGLAIIAFSIFLRFVLNPLTKPYLESMKRMRELNPKLAKLKEKHRGDKMKLTKAQADFYKENKINPSAGCLPYLLQIVVLIAFFRVFTQTLYPGIDTVEAFNSLLYQPLRFTQNEVVNTSFLYLDLTKPDVLNFPFLPFAIPGPLLILAALAQFVSSKMMAPVVEEEKKVARKTKGEADDFQVSMQKSMIYTFPLLTLFIGLKFPSGLALYWLIFSLFQAWQQYNLSGKSKLLPKFSKREAS